MNPSFYQVIYDPLRARVFFDATASLASYLSITSIFFWFNIPTPSILGAFFFSTCFVMAGFAWVCMADLDSPL